MLLFVLLPWVTLGEILSGVSNGKEEVQSLSSSLFSSVFDDLLDPSVPLEAVEDNLPPLIVRPATVYRPLRIRRSAKPRQVAYGNENKISSSPVPPSPQSTVSSTDTVDGAPSATPFDPQFRKAALASGLTVGVTTSDQMETEEKTSPQRLVLSELEDHVPSTTIHSTPTTVPHSAPSHSPTLSRPSAMSRVAEEEISEEEEEEERERPAPTRAPAPTTTTHSTTTTSTSASTATSTTASAPTTSPASASASDLFFSAPTSHSSSSSDASQSSTLSHSSSSSDASQSSTLSHSSSSSGASSSSTISHPSTSDVSPSSSISHPASDVSSSSTFSRTSSSSSDFSSDDSVPSSSATSSSSSVSRPSSSSSVSSSSSGSHNTEHTNQRPAHRVFQPSSSSSSHAASLPRPISSPHSNRRPSPSTTFRRPTHEPTGPTIVGGNSINYNGGGGGISQARRPAPISRPAYSSYRNNGARGSTYVLRPAYTGYSAPRPLSSGYARMQPVYHSARYSQPRFSYSPSYSVYSAPSHFVPYPQQGYNNGGTPTFSQYTPYGPISQPTTYWFTQPSGQTYQPAYTNAVPSYQSAQSYSPYGNTYKVGGGRYAYLG